MVQPASTAAAHIPEGHLQGPIPELPSWDQLRPCTGNYEWIANEESGGSEAGGGLPQGLAGGAVIKQPWLFDTSGRKALRFLCVFEC